jgi:hypothetical protein
VPALVLVLVLVSVPVPVLVAMLTDSFHAGLYFRL